MNEKVKSYLDNLNREFERVKNTIDLTAIEEAKQIILKTEQNGGRVHITGIGKPSYVAGYIASLLSSTGTPSYVLHGTEAIHGSSGQVLKGDVVIAISNSGETQELKQTVKTVKNNGAILIGVSGNEASWLSKNSVVHLYAGVKHEGDSLNKPPRASILVETLVLQILSVLLQEYKEITDEKYIKWHPGGALGKPKEGENNV